MGHVVFIVVMVRIMMGHVVFIMVMALMLGPYEREHYGWEADGVEDPVDISWLMNNSSWH